MVSAQFVISEWLASVFYVLQVVSLRPIVKADVVSKLPIVTIDGELQNCLEFVSIFAQHFSDVFLETPVEVLTNLVLLVQSGYGVRHNLARFLFQFELHSQQVTQEH